MENNVNLNSLSISELEQMVRDIDNYISSGIERYHYKQRSLEELLAKAKLSVANTPECLEVGKVYGITLGNSEDGYEFVPAKLIKIENQGVGRYNSYSTNNSCEYTACRFSTERYTVKDEQIKVEIDRNVEIRFMSGRKNHKLYTQGDNICNKIWHLEKDMLDTYYVGLSESLKKYLASNKEADRKLQLANWKIKEIKEIIKRKQESLFDGDQSEFDSDQSEFDSDQSEFKRLQFERLQQMYGKDNKSFNN